MANYVVLNDGETFSSLDGCVVLRLTEEQEAKFYDDLTDGYIKDLMVDPDVEKIDLSKAVLINLKE